MFIRDMNKGRQSLKSAASSIPSDCKIMAVGMSVMEDRTAFTDVLAAERHCVTTVDILQVKFV
jgi:hypothetical protein